MKIYTDGSYLEEEGYPRVGWGYVILDDMDNIIHEDYGQITGDYIHSRNITGEIKAVIKALIYCEEHEIYDVTIYHDYTGLKHWVTKKEDGNYEWQAKNELTLGYRAFVESSPVNVTFIKVKGHSKDKWNDYVDELAKRGSRL